MFVALAFAATIRIGLLDDAASVTFGAATESQIVAADGQRVPIGAQQPFEANPSGDALAVTTHDGTTLMLKPPVRLAPAGPVAVGKRWYRGTLELMKSANGITVVNEVPMDEYLYGVVPAEMPSSWPIEALKAQAVAARTYAVGHRGDYGPLGYDLKPTVQSQVYGGMGVEATASTLAVVETAGQILMFMGTPINAYYSAGAGGFTEGAEAVHGFERKVPGLRPGGYPYLQPVADFDWASPRWRWEVTLTRQRIREGLAAKGVDVGSVREVEVVERSYSGRARWVRVRGGERSREIPGQTFRMALGLNSTLFTVSRAGDDAYVLVGRGWGHGVGLSQWGARQMADWGHDYSEILSHFYQGAELEFGLPEVRVR